MKVVTSLLKQHRNECSYLSENFSGTEGSGGMCERGVASSMVIQPW